MSGTSLDGLDIALCKFINSGNKWEYSILKAQTFPYSANLKNKLSTAENLSGLDLILLHNEFGGITGEKINAFLENNNSNIDFIASHGHTIFHEPNKNLTLQIGSGAEIAAKTGITTICDFRSVDVALNGQGAPLVPIGDKLLFSEYTYCLNLGGFANISYDDSEGNRIAFDICPVNILLNGIVKEIGLDYDDKGTLASKGNLNNQLLQELNNLPFYNSKGPKSLGKEWLVKDVLPIINKYKIAIEDKLYTICEHIAQQISNSTNQKKAGKIFITGGGVFNKFLIELIKKRTNHLVEIPEENIINYKEALIFAFLGLLRFTNQINCLKSVTGAIRNNIGGAIYKSV
jgi:anhydro-N-acetylmuramic acid kinase